MNATGDRLRNLVPALAALTILSALGATLAAVAGVRVVGLARAQPDAGDPALLRELAERLLSPPFAAPGGEPLRTRLLPGALPELPFELPLPVNARLIGSIVRPSFARGPGVPPTGESIEVVLDVPESAPDVLVSYERTLAEQGWAVPALGRSRPAGGFVGNSLPMGTTYCLGEAGPVISLTTVRQSGRSIDLRLRVETGAPGPCGAAPPAPPIPPEAESLPTLRAPEGVRLQPIGGGGGPFFRSSDALAETELGIAELEAQFGEQLMAAGWTRRSSGTDALLAWSVWIVPSESERTGLLTVQAGPGARYRALHMQVLLDPAQAGAGPFFGWGTAPAPAPAVVAP